MNTSKFVHAHDAEVAVVVGVFAGLLSFVGGFFEVVLELLLDLEEGGLLVDEVLEEGGSRGGRGGGCLLVRDDHIFLVAIRLVAVPFLLHRFTIIM